MEASSEVSSETIEVDRAAAVRVGTFGDYLSLLRPTQWIKNVVVFAGPAAGLKLFDRESCSSAVLAFGAFCLAASGVYCINDAIDHRADACHPTKRRRPVARGAVKPGVAVAIGVVLVVLACTLSYMAISIWVAGVVGLYFLLTLAYSLALKQRVILDVIIIATGFVLRAWGGSLAVGVSTSEWLVACMFTLCLFMGFGKRRSELAMIGDSENAGRHRATLLRYTPQLLTHLITVSAGVAIVTFLLYTLDRTQSEAPFHKEHLFYTLPVVVYGVFRFAMLSESGLYSGPTEIVLKDKALLGAVVVWTAAAFVIVYQVALFGEGGIPGLFP